jgi:hypothetical protein
MASAKSCVLGIFSFAEIERRRDFSVDQEVFKVRELSAKVSGDLRVSKRDKPLSAEKGSGCSGPVHFLDGSRAFSVQSLIFRVLTGARGKGPN